MKNTANIPVFRIKAHKARDIMTDDKSRKGPGKTVISYLESWTKEHLYQRRKAFYSKYTDKGLFVEGEAIQYLSEHLNLGMLFKNEKRFENEFMLGIPDIILTHFIIEVKSSWDPFTFPLFSSEPDPQNFWQCQVYMHLTGKPLCKLVHVLVDTPDHLIDRELQYIANDLNQVELEPEQVAEFRASMKYNHLPPELRLKVFNIPYNPDAIKAIQHRVEQCRLIISNYLSSYYV
jgi:hypothetical protein